MVLKEDHNLNFKPASAVIESLQPDQNANINGGGEGEGGVKGDYRFSVGQLPSWAKRQVRGLHAGWLERLYICSYYIHDTVLSVY